MKQFAIFATIGVALSISLASCSQDEPAAAAPVAKAEVSRVNSPLDTNTPVLCAMSLDSYKTPIVREVVRHCSYLTGLGSGAGFAITDINVSSDFRKDLNDVINGNKPIALMYAKTAKEFKEFCSRLCDNHALDKVINGAEDAFNKVGDQDAHIAVIFNQDKVMVINENSGKSDYESAKAIMNCLLYNFLHEIPAPIQ